MCGGSEHRLAGCKSAGTSLHAPRPQSFGLPQLAGGAAHHRQEHQQAALQLGAAGLSSSMLVRWCCCMTCQLSAAGSGVNTELLHSSSLAPNASVHVEMARDKRGLCVYDALTGQLLHAWPLPAQERYCFATLWAWNHDSTALVLPFRGLEHHGPGPTTIPTSGFTVLTIQTGACMVVSLPRPQLPAEAMNQFVRHPQYAGQHVVAIPSVTDPADPEFPVWVFSCQDGSRVAAYSLEEQYSEDSMARRFWAPSGQAAAWVQPAGDGQKQTLCIWYPALGPPLQLPGQAAAQNSWCAWAPTSDALLVLTDAGAVTLFTSQGQAIQAPQELGFCSIFGVWSFHGAAVASSREVRLYSVADHALVLQHRVPVNVAVLASEGLACSPRIPNQVLSFSPSGSHVLVMLQAGMAIICTASGVKHEWQAALRCNDAVCWASDGAAVHLGFPTGEDDARALEEDPEALDYPSDQPEIHASFLCFN